MRRANLGVVNYVILGRFLVVAIYKTSSDLLYRVHVLRLVVGNAPRSAEHSMAPNALSKSLTGIL